MRFSALLNGTDRISALAAACWRRIVGLMAVGLLAGALAGCASAPPADDPDAIRAYRENNDPLEPYNRWMLSVNQGFEFFFVKPAATFYVEVLPDTLRQLVHNFVQNLNQPLYALNALLQGNGRGVYNTMARFLVNSSAGVGGLMDVMYKDIPNQRYDFGGTLAKWGVGDGPYFVMPVFGPFSARDAVGFGVDVYADPISNVAWAMGAPTKVLGIPNISWARGAVLFLDNYSQVMPALNDIERNSLDFYAALRSLSRQARAEELREMGITPPKAAD